MVNNTVRKEQKYEETKDAAKEKKIKVNTTEKKDKEIDKRRKTTSSLHDNRWNDNETKGTGKQKEEVGNGQIIITTSK